MTIENRFTELPMASTANMSDIICAVQGYVSPTNLGLSVQETLQQVFNLFQTNLSAPTTWAPTVSFATPGDLTVSYSIHTGFYTRIGGVVVMTFTLQFTPTYTTASGNMHISLPVSTNATANIFAFGTCLFQESNFPSGTSSLFLQALNNSPFFVVGSNGSGVPAAYMTTSQVASGVPVNLQGTMVYFS